MIYLTAKDGPEIAEILRGGGGVEARIKAEAVAARLTGKHVSPGMIITAPRRVGKTTELLKYAEEKNPYGQFSVVCHNLERQKQIISRHREVHNMMLKTRMVRARLLGEKLYSGDELGEVHPPLMITPGIFKTLRGYGGGPIYIDELGEISNEDTMKYVLDTGRFVAAVTS